MRTKKFMLTALMMVIAVGVSAQSVDMGALKSKRGDKPETGYVGTVELGANTYYNAPNYEIATTHGYAVSPFFTIGAGVAIDYDYAEQSFSLPAFLNMRTYFVRYGKARPFLDLRAGYQFLLSTRTNASPYGNTYYDYSEYDDDIYLNLSLGLRIVKRLDISVGVGYQYYTYYYYRDEKLESVDGKWAVPIGIRLAYRF